MPITKQYINQKFKTAIVVPICCILLLTKQTKSQDIFAD